MLGRSPVEQSGSATGPRIRLTSARIRAALKLTDGAAIVTTAMLARELTAPADGSQSLFWFAVACATLVGLDLFAAADAYRPRHFGSLAAQVLRSVGVWLALQGVMIVFAFLTGSLQELTLSFFLLWSAIAVPIFAALHGAVALVVAHGRRVGWLATRLFLVGAGPQAAHFIQKVRQHDPGIVIAGLFDDRRSRVPAEVEGCAVRGTLEDLTRLARIEPIDQIVITLPHQAAGRRLDCFERLRHLPVDVRLSPDLPDLGLDGHGVTELAGMPLLRVFDRPQTGWSRLAKWVEDRVLATLVLILAAPVMLVIAMIIRVTSPGPVLFRQRRYGFDNRAIEVLKFRTMHAGAKDAEATDSAWTRRRDPG